MVRRTYRLRCMIVAGFLALSSCGEVAFKRGEGAGQLAADRASCRMTNPDPATVHACLAEKGWHVAELSELQPPVKIAVMIPATAKTQSATQPSARTAFSDTMKDPPAIAQPAPAAVILPMPDEKIHVGSWWKYGAGDDLAPAAKACAMSLRRAVPASGYHLVTRSFYACMGMHGWHGLGHGAL